MKLICINTITSNYSVFLDTIKVIRYFSICNRFAKKSLLFFLFITEALDDFIKSRKPLVSVDFSIIEKLLHQNSNNNSDPHTPIIPNKDQLNDSRWLGEKRRHKKPRKTDISDVRGEIVKMRYEENLSLSQIQKELKETYGREVDRSTIYTQTKIDNPQKIKG